jgi:hypothetical protein
VSINLKNEIIDGGEKTEISLNARSAPEEERNAAIKYKKKERNLPVLNAQHPCWAGRSAYQA